MHTYIINYRSHSGSRFGLSLVVDSGWGPPFLSSSSMGEGKMQSVSFQDQPAVADDDEATERPTAVAEKEQPQVDTEDDTEDDTVTVGRKGSSWCRRWEEDYGLSMRKANRKYAVPRHVVKERLEIFWVNLFRLRLCHGGGTTHVVQPPDTDLNQLLRREYGKKEAHAAAAATHAAAVTDD